MTRLYIIRHGETDWNKANRTQGCSNDLSLNNNGILQAIAVAKKFKNINIDFIYSSSLKRAFETANEISIVSSVPVIITPELREMNFGCWEGLTFDEIKVKHQKIFELWSTNGKEALIPNGETLVMLQARVINIINEIIHKHMGKNIVIVSHGITIKTLILSILDMDISFHNRIKIDNAGLSIIDYHPKRTVLTCLNDICHLDKEVIE